MTQNQEEPKNQDLFVTSSPAPMLELRSRIKTSWPAFDKARAVARPITPAPITQV